MSGVEVRLTAEYRPGGFPHGDVVIRVCGVEVLTLPTTRPPGAEPGAARHLVVETIADAARAVLADRCDGVPTDASPSSPT